MDDENAHFARMGTPETAVIAAVMQWMQETRPAVSVERPSVSLLGRDPLHDLVTVLWRAALEHALDRASMEALLWAAVRHGEERRRQGFTEDALLDEYRVLRQLLPAQAHARLRVLGAFRDATDLVHAGITLCVGGAIRGFHRDSLAAAGDWPHVVQRFLRAFHPPGARSPGLLP